MTPVQHFLLGLTTMVIGAIKTWLHIGAIPVLALPTCTGKTVLMTAGGSSWLEQAHCWGCYAFLVGLMIALHAAFRQVQKRRSVALLMD